MLLYLDSNSASMITQAVVAGAAGAAVVAKTGWKRITSPFRGSNKSEQAAEAPVAAEASTTSSWDTPGGEG
ncbi:MAG: hypothetical protein QOF39_892 [Frankiales bacterium]|nr:hypothetical protein [Frankiales bacterium]